MIVSLIVATDRNGLVGRANELPWHLPADLKHFRAITMGKPIIMGRKTQESIGKPLPGRSNIVITRDRNFQAPGCTVVHSVEAALAAAENAEEVMIIGGARLYEQLLPQADRIYLTRIDHEFEGDTWFPEWQPGQWKEVEREDHVPDDRNPYHYSFLILERRQPPDVPAG
jgi:dihydrofolate reductase